MGTEGRYGVTGTISKILAAVFSRLGAIFCLLGAIIRSLKTYLFIAHSYSSRYGVTRPQRAGLTRGCPCPSLFTFLPSSLQKVGRSCGSADYFQYFCSGAEAHNEPK